MSDFTERFTEVHSLLISENNASLPVGVHDSPWVLQTNYHRGILVLNVLDMGAGATLDVQLRQATSTAGAGAAVIAGKQFTQLTQAGGDVDSDCAMELRTEELTLASNYDAVGVRATVAGAACVISYRYYGRVPRFAPVGVTAWTEVVG